MRDALFFFFPNFRHYLYVCTKNTTKARGSVYASRGIETRLCKHCCRGKAIVALTYLYICVCVCECLRACNLIYPACNVPPYCYLRPLSFHKVLRHYLTNGTILTKKVTEHKMCVLIFSTIFI